MFLVMGSVHKMSLYTVNLVAVLRRKTSSSQDYVAADVHLRTHLKDIIANIIAN